MSSPELKAGPSRKWSQSLSDYAKRPWRVDSGAASVNQAHTLSSPSTWWVHEITICWLSAPEAASVSLGTKNALFPSGVARMITWPTNLKSQMYKPARISNPYLWQSWFNGFFIYYIRCAPFSIFPKMASESEQLVLQIWKMVIKLAQCFCSGINCWKLLQYSIFLKILYCRTLGQPAITILSSYPKHDGQHWRFSKIQSIERTALHGNDNLASIHPGRACSLFRQGEELSAVTTMLHDLPGIRGNMSSLSEMHIWVTEHCEHTSMLSVMHWPVYCLDLPFPVAQHICECFLKAPGFNTHSRNSGPA